MKVLDQTLPTTVGKITWALLKESEILFLSLAKISTYFYVLSQNLKNEIYCIVFLVHIFIN